MTQTDSNRFGTTDVSARSHAGWHDRSWFRGGLAGLIAAGSTVVVSSYSAESHSLSLWIVGALSGALFVAIYFPLARLLSRTAFTPDSIRLSRGPTGISTRCDSLDCALCNPATPASISGYSQADFDSGKVSWDGLIHPDDRDRIQRAREDRQPVASGTHIHEYRITRKDGEERLIREVVRSGPESESPSRATREYYDITDLIPANRRCEAHWKQLRALAARQALSEELERQRLSAVLHDEVAQPLALAKMKLAVLRSQLTSQEAQAGVDAVRELLDESIAHTRSLTADLRPAVSMDEGIGDALRALCEQTQDRHSLNVEFREEALAPLLERDMTLTLFQCVRELVTNVVKHARAGHASVTLRRRDQRIEIEVADDGVGFESHPVPVQPHPDGGFGLFSLRERLAWMGGSLRIHSNPGQGSRVIIEAPLQDTTIPPDEEVSSEHQSAGRR